jgi:hypothetical protein
MLHAFFQKREEKAPLNAIVSIVPENAASELEKDSGVSVKNLVGKNKKNSPPHLKMLLS